jgi:hypothetical protein
MDIWLCPRNLEVKIEVLVIWQPLCEEESLAWDCSETPESA